MLYEVHDREGAVHSNDAKTEREIYRANNHHKETAEFLIAEGTYTIVFTLLEGSLGRPSLMLWRQRPSGVTILVGKNPSPDEQPGIDGVDGYLVGFGETVTRSFDVKYVDEDSVLYKSNANGFE